MSESKSFLVTNLKWRGCGQGYKHLTRFSILVLFKLQLVLCKRLTLSAAFISVTEGLFIYIFFLLFDENYRNQISKTGENISPTISLFFRKMIA